MIYVVEIFLSFRRFEVTRHNFHCLTIEFFLLTLYFVVLTILLRYFAQTLHSYLSINSTFNIADDPHTPFTPGLPPLLTRSVLPVAFGPTETFKICRTINMHSWMHDAALHKIINFLTWHFLQLS